MKLLGFRISGINSRHRGQIEIAASGFKHSATMLLAAAPLLPSPLQMENFPKIKDVLGMTECLRYLGCDIQLEQNSLTIDSRNMRKRELPASLTNNLHGPLYFLPALAKRLGSFRIGPLGGCRIGDPAINGERPTAHVLDVLQHFGAIAREQPDGGFYVKLAERDFTGTTIDVKKWSADPNNLSGPLVSGVTKTAILAALGVKSGVTKIINPDLRTETQGLIDACIEAGWNIKQDSQSISVESYPENLRRLALIQIPSDLIEIITYIALAVCTNRPATLSIAASTDFERALAPEIMLLRKMGVELVQKGTNLQVTPHPPHRPFEIKAGPPGIYSDTQPFFALIASTCDGVSIIRDDVWKNRFNYVKGLRAMGLDIAHNENEGTIAIRPGSFNTDEVTVKGDDLRSTAVLAIAASSRNGVTFLDGADALERGYEDMPAKLRNCGVNLNIIADGGEE
jgi:UDP-N-acetylglucosamine 1-carboxyvinyltransferase